MCSLKKHDGVSETFVCRGCMVEIDPVGGNYPGWTKEQCDSGVCPHCGGTDTGWLFSDEPETGQPISWRSKGPITEIKVYWDAQGKDNEGWAYVASDDIGEFESGAIDCDQNDLSVAIEEACRILGVEIPTSHFATMKDDGGFAIWTPGEGS